MKKEQTIIQIFENHEAIWIHDHDVTKPHAQLTTGLHSDGYFNCRKVLRDPYFCEMLARQLFRIIQERAINYVIDWVVGSPYSAITFSYELAKLFHAKHGFTEKDPSDSNGKKMIWKEDPILSWEKVLQIEELITTSNTFFEVRRAIQSVSTEPVNFVPFVGCIVHRPSKLPVSYDGVEVVSLIEKKIWTAKPEDCLLCKAGSKPLRPKGNWIQLTQKK